MENFYWRKGNQWDDNPKEEEQIDTSNMLKIGEYTVCTFCDNKNCNDYISVPNGYFDPDFYCKHRQCKFDIKDNKFEVNKVYKTSALYGGELIIKVISRTENSITYVFTDDNKKTYYNKEIVLQNDIESIEAWEYKGNKCYWYSKEV